jgi:transcription initiation factor IIE alpha subunit
MDYDWNLDISCLNEDFGKQNDYFFCNVCDEKTSSDEAYEHPETGDSICEHCYEIESRKALSLREEE